MKEYLPILTRCSLFEGIDEDELLSMLDGCLEASIKKARKGADVLRGENNLGRMGVVLEGRVLVETNDYWGKRSILSSVEPLELFGESLVCQTGDQVPLSVVAQEDSVILLLSCSKLLTTCSTTCARHQQIIKNLLLLLASKNVGLTRKLDHITKKSTRDKVLSYLSEQAKLANSNTVHIPFNRQELADYLSVDRSALSSTLSTLSREGLISYRKNRFTLL